MAAKDLDVEADFLEAIVQHPHPVDEPWLVRHDQRGIRGGQPELVEVDARSCGLWADGPDELVVLVQNDTDPAAMRTALRALPVAEMRQGAVCARVEVVDIGRGAAAGGGGAGPY